MLKTDIYEISLLDGSTVFMHIIDKKVTPEGECTKAGMEYKSIKPIGRKAYAVKRLARNTKAEKLEKVGK